MTSTEVAAAAYNDPAIAALVLYPLGQVFAALISLILAGAGLAGGFCLYVNRMLRPTHHIATAIERFRRGDSAVRCPEKAPGRGKTDKRERLCSLSY